MQIRTTVNTWGLSRLLLRHLLKLFADIGGLFSSADKPEKQGRKYSVFFLDTISPRHRHKTRQPVCTSRSLAFVLLSVPPTKTLQAIFNSSICTCAQLGIWFKTAGGAEHFPRQESSYRWGKKKRTQTILQNLDSEHQVSCPPSSLDLISKI